MREVWFLRHAKTVDNENEVYNEPEDILSQTGKEACIEAAPWLGRQEFTKVYCSPMRRTKETANLLHLAPAFDDRLKDVAFGVYAGKPWGSVHKYCDENNIERLSYVLPGGESHNDVLKRIESFLADLPKEGKFLIIGHSGGIAHAVFALTGTRVVGYPHNLSLWVVQEGKLVHNDWTPWR